MRAYRPHPPPLLQSPLVRYAAMVMGEHPVVVDVTARDIAELRDFLIYSPWAAPVESVHATLLLQTFKRGGVVTDHCGRP